jgi:NAD(P)H dehydrogenase (quinone)
MSAEKFLVTGATGRTGCDTVQRLVEKRRAVRALVHREDERSEALRGMGAEVVVGDLLERGDTIGATTGTSAAYFCYPIRPGIIQATAYFANAAKPSPSIIRTASSRAKTRSSPQLPVSGR